MTLVCAGMGLKLFPFTLKNLIKPIDNRPIGLLLHAKRLHVVQPFCALFGYLKIQYSCSFADMPACKNVFFKIALECCVLGEIFG